MPNPLEIRLVVFDWAGTTIDYGCMAPAWSFVNSFAARGVVVTIAEARGPMGLHKKDHIRAMLHTPSVAAKWRTATGRDWSEADVEELYHDVTPRLLEAVERHSELIASVSWLIPGLRNIGLKIAATTGYFRAAADAVLTAAKRQGYTPDFNICADDVPAGRPAPWMIFRCMEALNVYPPAAVVKVGDTGIDIEEGRNAGCWSVGVIDSSNEMGLTAAEFAALAEGEKESRREEVGKQFANAGAHTVIDTLTELPALVAEFNARLACGERP